MASTTPAERATDTLRSLGLTDYEAQCLVALCRVSDATASEVAELCDVPRSRVYDIADRLVTRGLAEVQDGNPRRYRAVPVQTVLQGFEDEFREQLERLESTLTSLSSPPEHREEDRGVWTINGRKSVIERAQRLIDEAEDELFLMITTEDLLEGECLTRLGQALDRNVSVTVATESAAVMDRLADMLPQIETVDSPVDWLGLPAENSLMGRIVMADRQAVLIATIDDSHPAGDETVTGVWSRGEDSGMVSVLRQLIGFRIDELATAADGSGS